jgi:hypothetical protein
MSTPRLLTPRPTVTFDTNGRRTLVADVVVDLGEAVWDLHRWAFARPDGDQIVRYGGGFHGTTVIRVPAGLRYDGASLPLGPIIGGLTYLLVGKKEKYELAGLVHDLLYQCQAPRAAADRVFWLIARSGEQNVGPVRGWLTWVALRAGGWPAYRSHAA